MERDLCEALAQGVKERLGPLPIGLQIGEIDAAYVDPQHLELARRLTPNIRRQSLFCNGRLQAAKAMNILSGQERRYLVDYDRHFTPRWPDGFIGSISHSYPYSAALMARKPAVASVGIDFERLGRVNAAIWPSIFTPKEIFSLKSIADKERQNTMATVLFAAKEAFQKALFLHRQAWSELSRLDIIVDEQAGTFFPGNCNREKEKGIFYVEKTHVIAAFIIE